MIRGEQKGPHQQVRFWLSLSVLPTAPGTSSPAGPVTGPHPELCPRPGVEVQPAGKEAWASALSTPHLFHRPQSQDGPSHGKVFLELPRDLGPSPHPETPQLSSVRVLLEA